MERLLDNLTIFADEDDGLVIESEDLEEVVEGSDLCLVGRFLTDQSINPNIMKGRMADLWNLKKGFKFEILVSGSCSSSSICWIYRGFWRQTHSHLVHIQLFCIT